MIVRQSACVLKMTPHDMGVSNTIERGYYSRDSFSKSAPVATCGIGATVGIEGLDFDGEFFEMTRLSEKVACVSECFESVPA